MTTVYDFTARAADGRELSLGEFRDRALLIVNVASRCGFTPQYAGLEALQQKFGPRGFSVLAFPCNQFGAQEPGSEAEICAFATGTFGATFPIFAKTDVNGEEADPLWTFLTTRKPGLLGRSVRWNFTKFLIDRTGRPVARFAPSTRPKALEPKIEAVLAD